MFLGDFIQKWLGQTGGAERSNYQLFLTEFAQALNLPTAQPGEQGVLGDYQFDGPVAGGSEKGNAGFIDLYKRGSFILEAKQSKLTVDQQNQLPLDEQTMAALPATPSGARYDRLMRDALAQAKRYAVNLPGDHPWPPFLIVCDVGRAFELYFDWTGNGRGYGFFPSQQNYRFTLDRFAEPDVQALFCNIWTDPAKVDPRAKSAEVSRDIARRLAQVSQWLEGSSRFKGADASDSARSRAIEDTALFLMRIVFCMFAEDVGLLPKKSFTNFLEKAVANEAAFEPELRQLWSVMAREGGERYASAIGGDVRFFNGGLFESTQTYGLSTSDRGELFEAAKHDWRNVEPAIFGTLLEQALTPSERAKLGAHYTPRPYVERLVQATIMDLLESEWLAAQTDLLSAQSFHTRLKALRILDPACGTGNFLYVAMESLMRLESEVVETIGQLGGRAMSAVGPHQFLGLELNPRAAVIAELVLWIGWLRWRTNNDPEHVPDPVLKRHGNINGGGHAGYDAVVRRTATGEPDTDNAGVPDWPEADFIIGNPPFIGGKDLRAKLGGDYAEALWKANPRVPKSADFVMQWWDRAAHILVADNSALVRFGFVTTNSITQEFSRRVIAGYLNPYLPEREGDSPKASGVRGASKAAAVTDSPSPRSAALSRLLPQGERGLSLILAIPDHPWTKATKDAAAVRIAMTVAARGQHPGTLMEVRHESGLDSDAPVIEMAATQATIHADLSVGANVGSAHPLKANEGLSSRGVALHGAGFIVTPKFAVDKLGLGEREGLEAHIRPYRHGRDLLQRPRDVMVIDLQGLTEKEVRTTFPEVYQHVLEKVKPERDKNREPYRKENWWVFGRKHVDLRDFLADLPRYITTVETAKHRIFQFLDASILPDNKLLAIGSDDVHVLGVLSSAIHQTWANAMGGLLEDRPVYVKSKCFDPFPFPEATAAQRAVIAELAEELDATRRAALDEVPGLTMTEIYNLRDKLRSGAALSLADQDRARAARAGIVDRLHDQIDAAVADAYGWPADLPPSEIVSRLVILNATRAAEEAAGTVRWLRPDYQMARFGGTPPD
jgi:hypothetical protein